jgi:hypothetical protein
MITKISMSEETADETLLRRVESGVANRISILPLLRRPGITQAGIKYAILKCDHTTISEFISALAVAGNLVAFDALDEFLEHKHNVRKYGQMIAETMVNSPSVKIEFVSRLVESRPNMVSDVLRIAAQNGRADIFIDLIGYASPEDLEDAVTNTESQGIIDAITKSRRRRPSLSEEAEAVLDANEPLMERWSLLRSAWAAGVFAGSVALDRTKRPAERSRRRKVEN